MGLVVVFVVAALIAPLLNLAVLRLRYYDPRGYATWNGLANWLADFLGFAKMPTLPEPAAESRKRSKKGKKPARENIAPRSLMDAVPVYGWWRLRREEPLHGGGFWIRPFLLEIAFPVFLTWLYSWQVQSEATVPKPSAAGADLFADAQLIPLFVASAILIACVAIVSLVDLDEFLIPDAVIVPGTVIGVFWITLLPESLPPILIPPNFVHVASPNVFPNILDFGTWSGLAIGIGCVCLWSFALMRRVWRRSRGFRFAIGLFAARLRRSQSTRYYTALGIAGSAAVWAVWQFGAAANWQAMITSLLGMTIGAVIIWTVRIVSSATLRKEAMGFGDVTLWAMVGAYLGWQACVFGFFIAPLFALIPALTSAVIRRTTQQAIPFGPFLGLGAITVIVFWGPIWLWGELMFAMGWFLPAALLLCIPVLAILLGLWQFGRFLVDRRRSIDTVS